MDELMPRDLPYSESFNNNLDPVFGGQQAGTGNGENQNQYGSNLKKRHLM